MNEIKQHTITFEAIVLTRKQTEKRYNISLVKYFHDVVFKDLHRDALSNRKWNSRLSLLSCQIDFQNSNYFEIIPISLSIKFNNQ